MTTSNHLREKILQWAADHYKTVAYYDNNHYPHYRQGAYEVLIAVGAVAELSQGGLAAWRDFVSLHQGEWLFAGLSYDLKNELEQLHSQQHDGLGFPLLHCFVPEHLFIMEKGRADWQVYSKTDTPDVLWAQIMAYQPVTGAILPPLPPLQRRFTAAEYCRSVAAIREHIAAGDVYELNFCQEFFIEQAQVSPLALFQRLNAKAKAPFSAYYKTEPFHLLCASPERFIQKQGDKLLSQPIKGTQRRDSDPVLDDQMRQLLQESVKDRAENVMIVDLVRNDLAKSCRWGSIAVEECFGIYPFEQVWQMISTISGRLRSEVDIITALQNAFPMGSMTGAPKVMTMQLIEQYERSRRGWYSGSVGYITPQGDCDWNVVIRSLFYNADNQYLSFHVGGAIVYDSVPEAEYQECLLKAKAILQILDKTLN